MIEHMSQERRGEILIITPTYLCWDDSLAIQLTNEMNSGDKWYQNN